MTEEILLVHYRMRRRHARYFLTAPWLWKVCEQCNSLVRVEAPLCPWCEAYQFITASEKVCAIAREMAKQPFPVNAGVVPRLKFEA